MVSISSSKLIRERTLDFCTRIKDWSFTNEKSLLFQDIGNHLQHEYNIIPEKERIGKGIVYISKYVAKEMFYYLKIIKKDEETFLIEFVEAIFNYGKEISSSYLQQFALLLLSEFILHIPEKFDMVTSLIKKYGDHEDWTIRESTCFSIISGIKKDPKSALQFLLKLTKSDNENHRRLVAESLRPTKEVKWLRDPSKNDEILEILSILRKDPSIYVRKAVGNNIKDLSKYMPEKMLDLLKNWLKLERNIKIHDELATEVGLNKDEKRLIWTMKHAMRWIKERNPKYHEKLEKLLGKNYILYFDEKKNKLAKPK